MHTAAVGPGVWIFFCTPFFASSSILAAEIIPASSLVPDFLGRFSISFPSALMLESLALRAEAIFLTPASCGNPISQKLFFPALGFRAVFLFLGLEPLFPYPFFSSPPSSWPFVPFIPLFRPVYLLSVSLHSTPPNFFSLLSSLVFERGALPVDFLVFSATRACPTRVIHGRFLGFLCSQLSDSRVFSDRLTCFGAGGR